MATLVNSQSGSRIVLLPQHVFGRDGSAATALCDAYASRLHASVRWTGGHWELRDHSRNGTLIDGRRIQAHAAHVLLTGQVLRFGLENASTWIVQDVNAPGPVLVPLDGGDPVALTRSNLLPHGDDVSVALAQEANGEWVCTSQDGVSRLRDGEELLITGRRWRFHTCSDALITQNSNALTPDVAAAICSARFSVSLDEEHVLLHLTCGSAKLDLGERTHHYALLTLARRRMQDAQRGLSPTEQGWTEHVVLAQMLGLEASHLNIHIFRLRQQVAQLLGPDTLPPALIERRRGGLRLGDVSVEIHRGSTPQLCFSPARAGVHAREQGLKMD